jgi:hypothetical protein
VLRCPPGEEPAAKLGILVIDVDGHVRVARL